MIRVRRIPRLLGVSVVAMLCGGPASAQSSSAPNLLPTTKRPDAYGTQDYTITTISATSFLPADSSQGYHTSGSLGRYGDLNVTQHFYATLDIPAGVIIDYLGFNNLNDGTPLVMGAALWSRDSLGGLIEVAGISNAAHPFWQTDVNSIPIGYPYYTHVAAQLILDVGISASPNPQYFGSVEVSWRRVVAAAPPQATFNDVPTSHPFFQYIEALKASGITGGCQASPPLYCPNNPVTRGQMAVFLAKALGLHFPQ